MEALVQCQNNFNQSTFDCNQSIDRLEATISYLVNTINDRMKKLSLPNFWPFPIPLAILMGTKNHVVLDTLTKIQFHHILNLINPKPLTNWQVFTSRKLNLIVNVSLIPNFVIQFHFLNLCWLRYSYPSWHWFIYP